MRSRWIRQAAWVVPALICVCLYWPGLMAWFQRDDFAWLGLRLEVFTPSDLWRAMFAPKAQGTIRPWSERGFFMLYSKLFGLESLPYRLTVFATQILAIFLLNRVTFRLTSSRLAAFLAPLFWVVNAALGTPLSWTSAYNQIMCSAFLLGAFLLWLNYAATGRRSYYAGQFAVFLLGFGALEINIIYPGLVIAWCVLAREWRRLPAALPMAAASIGYFAYHRSVAPRVVAGPYALHFDSSLLSTLWTYWLNAFGGRELDNLLVPDWFIALGKAAPFLLTAALALFVIVAAWRGRWLSLFGLAWFLAAIGPVLPLRDHISEYYLAIPTIGLALLAAEAVSYAGNWKVPAGAAALAAAVTLYVIPSGYVARSIAVYNRDQSQATELLVFGIERAREIHPKKVILLTDISNELFWFGMNDKPFRLLGIENVFLAPGAESAIQEHPDLGDVKSLLFPAGQVTDLLDSGQAVVYSAATGRLRNVTRTYQTIAASRWKPGLAHRIEPGNPLFARYLLEGWHEAHAGTRWMSRRATLEMRGPDRPSQRLTLQGYLSAAVLVNGPLTLTVSVDGTPLHSIRLSQPDSEFIEDVKLPDTLAGHDRIKVTLELDKSVVPADDGRELGLLFGSLTIH